MYISSDKKGLQLYSGKISIREISCTCLKVACLLLETTYYSGKTLIYLLLFLVFIFK